MVGRLADHERHKKSSLRGYRVEVVQPNTLIGLNRHPKLQVFSEVSETVAFKGAANRHKKPVTLPKLKFIEDGK